MPNNGLLPSLPAALMLALAAAPAASAQTGGVTHVDSVPAPSLRANLLGDPAWRRATVYLPPSYSRNPHRRYPVVYLLHGFAADHRAFMKGAYQNLNIRISADSLIKAGRMREMLIVTPDARNAFEGSFYMNSPVTGAWEDFITKDLVSYVDRRYRTIRDRSARGIAGHSMGGFGALRIGMRHPTTFSSIYALSACCLAAGESWESGYASLTAAEARAWRNAIQLTERANFLKSGFLTNIYIALAAAYSPNPSKPPFFVDLPYRMQTDSLVLVESVARKWNRGPLALVRPHAKNLKRMNIAFDAGTADGFPDIPLRARSLHELLDSLGIRHTFELYEGTHGNRIRARIEQNVLPFFSATLTRSRADRVPRTGFP